jgi:AbrB family looped-hinge helix DNA binding protein
MTDGMTTTVTESNQVSIPPEIAHDLDIHPGTRLEWAKTGEGTILVKPLPSRGELARQLMGAGRRLLKRGADPIGDLIREREQDDRLDQADERQCSCKP